MPHFGPRVIGVERFSKQKALEDATSNLHFGSRVVGPPPAPESAVVEGRPAREAIEALRNGGDIAAIAEEELARAGGPRKSVAKAILAAAAERGANPELVDRVMAASLAESES